MVSGPANTENLCSLVKALYENALFYQQSYFEILLISNIIVLIPEPVTTRPFDKALSSFQASSQAHISGPCRALRTLGEDLWQEEAVRSHSSPLVVWWVALPQAAQL